MTTSRLTMISLTLFSLALASCEKLTDLVKGDVSCKIDGKSWTSFADDFKLDDAEGRISNNGERVRIMATNTKTSERIDILISTPGKPIAVGKYILNSQSHITASYYLSNVGQFTTGNGYQGEVEITGIDKERFQIKGKFNFSGYNELIKRAVVVSDGRFDVDYMLY